MSDDVPKKVEETIDKISQSTGISKETLISEYQRIFNDPFVQTNECFETDEEKHEYSILILWAWTRKSTKGWGSNNGC